MAQKGVAGTVVRAVLQEFILRRQERIVTEKARRKQDALSEIEFSSSSRSRSRSEHERTQTGSTMEEPVAADRSAEIDRLIEQETCGTCRMVLNEAKALPPGQQAEVIGYYKQEYKPAKEAFNAGEIDMDELAAATDGLLDVADID